MAGDEDIRYSVRRLFELGDSAFPDVVNSPLLTASIGNGSRSIRLQNSTVTIRLKKRMVDGPPAGYRHLGYTTAEPRCVFWVEDDTATSQVLLSVYAVWYRCHRRRSVFVHAVWCCCHGRRSAFVQRGRRHPRKAITPALSHQWKKC